MSYFWHVSQRLRNRPSWRRWRPSTEVAAEHMRISHMRSGTCYQLRSEVRRLSFGDNGWAGQELICRRAEVLWGEMDWTGVPDGAARGEEQLAACSNLSLGSFQPWRDVGGSRAGNVRGRKEKPPWSLNWFLFHRLSLVLCVSYVKVFLIFNWKYKTQHKATYMLTSAIYIQYIPL